MEKNSSKFAGVIVRAFISLMVVSILGILLKFFITIPNRLFFNRLIAYTSTHYSYKPGQNGWTFDFFVLNNDGLYVALPLLLVIFIAFIFYFGVFSAIAAFLNFKAQNTQLAKRDFILTLLVVSFYFMPKYINIESFFNINERGAYVLKERIYNPNNEIWEIGIQKIKGIYIKDHKTVSNDSSFLVVKKINTTKVDTVLFEKLVIPGSNIYTFNAKNTLWLLEASNNYLKAFNMVNSNMVIKNKEDLNRMMPKKYQNRGVAELSYSTAQKNSIYVKTNYGEVLYLHTDDNLITDKYKYTHNTYYLRRINEHRYKLLAKKKQLATTLQEAVFLNAEIISYTNNVVIIRHKVNIKKETPYTISAYNAITGNKLWDFNEENNPFLNDVYGKIIVDATFLPNKTILSFYDAFTLKGNVIIDNHGNHITQGIGITELTSK
ncbi:membrane hypothetical protein [Tenacibaculum litoreum]|uniref:hypothetical protein n=1 Tax=Tenacibaculum litoreum TaxID=321269 RepID=UPI0038952B9D